MKKHQIEEKDRDKPELGMNLTTTITITKKKKKNQTLWKPHHQNLQNSMNKHQIEEKQEWPNWK